MKYLENYDVWDDTRDIPEIENAIEDYLIDLRDVGFRVVHQIQRKNNIILIYISGKMSSNLFSLDDIKEPVNHLISFMEGESHPLVKLSHKGTSPCAWSIMNCDRIETSNYTNIKNINCFEIKFKLK